MNAEKWYQWNVHSASALLVQMQGVVGCVCADGMVMRGVCADGMVMRGVCADGMMMRGVCADGMMMRGVCADGMMMRLLWQGVMVVCM